MVELTMEQKATLAKYGVPDPNEMVGQAGDLMRAAMEWHAACFHIALLAASREQDEDVIRAAWSNWHTARNRARTAFDILDED